MEMFVFSCNGLVNVMYKFSHLKIASIKHISLLTRMEAIYYYVAWKVLVRLTWYLIHYFWHYFCFKKLGPFKFKKESTNRGTEQ